MRALLLSSLAALFLALSGSTFAQPAPEPEDLNIPETIELSLVPAAEPVPALRYQLLAPPSERTAGNAAQYYYRAILHLNNYPKDHWKRYDENQEKWLSSDPLVFPKSDVAKWLPTGAWHSQLEIATHREYCDWDYRIQDLRGMEVISFLLQEVQDCRSLARVIQLKAHLEIMEGRPEDALKTLRLGYQLAHDVAQPPLLINGLVGIAIATMMNQELVLLIDRSNINLYWAVAALPSPLIDLRPALQFEMGMPQQLFSFLKDAETAQRTPEEWRRLMIEGMVGLEGLASESTPKFSGWQAELAAAAMVAKLYPIAKDALIASGLDRQRVEEMPVGQVVAIHTARSIDHAYQQVFKVSLLPYDQAIQRMPQVMQQLTKDGYLGPNLSGNSGLPIANLLLPAVGNVIQAEIRLVRGFAVIQAIEAIRMHAAATGKLPASLDEITIVPVPSNPATGQPFAYKLDAATGVATLEFPAVANQPPRHDAKRYVIRLEKNDP